MNRKTFLKLPAFLAAKPNKEKIEENQETWYKVEWIEIENKHKRYSYEEIFQTEEDLIYGIHHTYILSQVPNADKALTKILNKFLSLTKQKQLKINLQKLECKLCKCSSCDGCGISYTDEDEFVEFLIVQKIKVLVL